MNRGNVSIAQESSDSLRLFPHKRTEVIKDALLTDWSCFPWSKIVKRGFGVSCTSNNNNNTNKSKKGTQNTKQEWEVASSVNRKHLWGLISTMLPLWKTKTGTYYNKTLVNILKIYRWLSERVKIICLITPWTTSSCLNVTIKW